jgi:hypothetical protein
MYTLFMYLFIHLGILQWVFSEVLEIRCTSRVREHRQSPELCQQASLGPPYSHHT